MNINIPVVILAVVVIIAAILVYPIFTCVRSSGPSPTLSNLHSTWLCLEQYAQDNRGVLPPMRDARTVDRSLASYVNWTKNSAGQPVSDLIDPATQEPFQPNPVLSGKKLARFGKAEAWTVAFYAPHADEYGGRRVIMLDGKSHYIRAEDWPRVQRASGMP